MEDVLHLRVESGKLEQVYGIAHVIRRLVGCSGSDICLCQTCVIDICGELENSKLIELLQLLYVV